jgi:response regulator RpfG family c-di-GMP phosphodiesterase
LPAANPPLALPPKAKMVCDVLVRDKLLPADRAAGLLAQARASGERIEELLLELELVQEAGLLKALAMEYKVHFISTERLAKADIPRALVNMIPQRFAEKVGACPVVFDAKTHALTVITADPDDSEALKEVQLASGAREVKPVLARPAAVKALLAKAYAGDLHAFDLLDRRAHMTFGATAAGRTIALDEAARKQPPAPPPLPQRSGGARSKRTDPNEKSRRPSLSFPPTALAKPAETAAVAPAGAVAAAVAAPVPSVTLSTPGPTAFTVPAATGTAAAAGPSLLELLNVLVSLLENERADLRGHSAQVARLARRLAEKLTLDPAATAAVVCAAYVHDLGKMGQFHLTSLNCSQYDGHRVAAQKVYDVPPRLLEPARLPLEATQAARHMYERWDGSGFPDGLGGKDIPLGARILAIADTYADLTQNPRNPYRKTLAANEACGALSAHRGIVFDPNLVDLFHHTVLGEDLKARLLATRSQALLVDTDPEETTVLELRMIEQGFVVKTARSAEQALKALAEGETDLVVSEIDLGARDGAGPKDGLELLAHARQTAWGKDLPWVVYTRRQERAVAQRALEMGVLDFVNKPASAEVMVAKLKAMLDQRASARGARGVSGSLREMGLPDMVQVLFHGRKSGGLRIRAAQGKGGEIHFLEGNVVHALWGDLAGADAFYAMLRLADGDFALDPSFQPTTRTIHESSEALLLEGMRRLDEGIGP